MKDLLRRNRSWLTALAMVGAMAAWMASGDSGTGEAEARPAPGPDPVVVAVEAPFRVRVTVSRATPVTREVVLRGRTEPSRAVTLRAEVDGRVVEVGPVRGAHLSAGDVVARLDLRDREARLAQARAEVLRYEIEFAAYSELEKSNYQSRMRLAEAGAGLAAAHAAARRVEVEIANTRLIAPFDGVLERRPVEVGDFLSSGDEVARVIERDPIVITGHVTQRELAGLEVGAPGTATLVTGERLEGRLRYVATESDDATRTFAVELEAANPDGRVAAGVTAEVRVPTDVVAAHRLSPALLSLDEGDRIGVKSVGDDGTVEFHPVDLVRADAGGIWVSGLPEQVRIITVGQGFVHAGDRVEAVLAGERALGSGS